MLPPDAGEMLVKLARATLEEALEGGLPPDLPAGRWAAEPGASFVTLRQGEELRGCVGSIEAHRTLAEDVCMNALAAAFRDPRFPRLTADELPHTRIEVAVLSPRTPIAFSSEREALERLRPNVDGIVLRYGTLRSVFLPQVWEDLPDPKEFLAHLKEKAGLPGSFWSTELELERFETAKFKEAEASP
jgi:AmmeMemoRadiSam system protein A